jgi:hypothetical protein
MPYRLRDERGKRAINGGSARFQDDPHWRDLILFYEYFHGDNGAGLGASHQTGWTGVIARLMDVFGRLDKNDALDVSKSTALRDMTRQSARGEATHAPSESSSKTTAA